jgi:hypothetical protein
MENKMTEYKYGAWRKSAGKKEDGKYFRQRDRITWGILGDGSKPYNPGQFAKYELTTKEGVNNDIKLMVKHHKALLRKIERFKGIKLDYVAVPELSPQKGLIHIHGIMRNNSYIGEDEIIEKYTLSEWWEKIHGAKITWISAPRSFHDATQYMVKHTIKEYPESSRLGFRALTSKHWLPVNCELVKKLIVKATQKVIMTKAGVEPEEQWSRCNQSMKLWVLGRNTRPLGIVDAEPFYINGEYVFTFRGKKYKVRDYAMEVGIIKE